MENRNSDIFELTKNTENADSIPKGYMADENPFLKLSAEQEQKRHLNDYDFNILRDGAYKDISDDIFKLEYKISRTEKEIKDLENQISAAKEINDQDKINDLQFKLYSLKEDYSALLTIYNDKTLSAKITGSVSEFVEKTTGAKISDIKATLSKYFDLLISKMPQKISCIFKIKKSLSLLTSINKSVDELVNMTIPYGENIDKYRQLSKYIVKANSIQSEIAGYIGKNG